MHCRLRRRRRSKIYGLRLTIEKTVRSPIVNPESSIPMTEILHWLTQNLSDVPQDDDWLSEAEHSVLAGLRFPKRRDDWKLGRWTAKRAICACHARDSAVFSHLEIRAAADGAPEAFWDNRPAEVSISISHSRQRSFCVVGPMGRGVGCDLEWIEPREENLPGDYFRPEEIYCVQHAPAEQALVINLIWSAKEAVLKTLRQGLRRDTRSVAIHPDFPGLEGAWNPWTGRCLESSRVFYGWWRACEGYIYTAASDQITSAPEEIIAADAG
jgi:4'-phosphopantetheinyl transferase